jgi:FkbH-like protein
MEARVEGLTAYNLPRAAQLTQRSNQFNLRTKRFTEDQLQEWERQAGHEVFNFYLCDRFGDHGLIAVVMLEAVAPKAFFIHNWLMSCRVLKRGMEAFTLNYLAAWARSQGAGALWGERLATAKNGLVEDLLPSLGFRPAQKERWCLALDEFTPLPTPVKKKTEDENN